MQPEQPASNVLSLEEERRKRDPEFMQRQAMEEQLAAIRSLEPIWYQELSVVTADLHACVLELKRATDMYDRLSGGQEVSAEEVFGEQPQIAPATIEAHFSSNAAAGMKQFGLISLEERGRPFVPPEQRMGKHLLDHIALLKNEYESLWLEQQRLIGESRHAFLELSTR